MAKVMIADGSRSLIHRLSGLPTARERVVDSIVSDLQIGDRGRRHHF